MSRKNVSVGIDIGTYQVKVLVAEENEKDPANPNILGVGFTESKGLRHGYIIHQTDAIRSIRKAVYQAEKASGIKINKAFLSVGGIGLSSHTSSGTIMISRADSEISELDIEKVIHESEQQIPSTVSINRKVIHTIPMSYKIDGKAVFGNPVGMKGVKLEVETLFITSLEHHLSELIQAVEDAGVEIVDVMAAPLASSLVTLTKPEKMAGCVLANIGSETVSIVVYEDDIPISLEVFPIGSNDITNDIALGLQVSLEEAEALKHNIHNQNSHPKKKLEDIISARLSDIFELIEAHLKKIGKNGLLPAGIIITGGGSGITTMSDIAKAYLKLPTKVSRLACDARLQECVSKSSVKIKDATWAVAYGLTVFGLHSDGEGIISSGVGKKLFKSTKNTIIKFFKQFLP